MQRLRKVGREENIGMKEEGMEEGIKKEKVLCSW